MQGQSASYFLLPYPSLLKTTSWGLLSSRFLDTAFSLLSFPLVAQPLSSKWQ